MMCQIYNTIKKGIFMNILVINAGSSSLKYQVIDMNNEQILAKGNCERIGIDGAVTHKTSDDRIFESNFDLPSHKDAFRILSSLLVDKKYGVVNSLKEISAVGHRVVQGAEEFKSSVIVTDEVLKKIESLSVLAPLHNSASVEAIRACQATFDNSTPQVVVFDTSFHQTIPEKAYLYGFPYECYEKYRVRKYGFHGTSHRYVSKRVEKILGKPPESLKIVSCHLGNGSSICAILNGKSIDTTMGLTPLDGVIMGTRTGNVDPSCVTFLMNQMQYNAHDMDIFMNKKSGLFGISGISSDYRDIKKAADSGNKRAKIALDMLSYQIRKGIASSAVAMDGIDVLIFTGGIGENSHCLREDICNHLNIFGIEINKMANAETIHGKEGIISTENSKVSVCIIPTNEELMIAKDALKLTTGNLHL